MRCCFLELMTAALIRFVNIVARKFPLFPRLQAKFIVKWLNLYPISCINNNLIQCGNGMRSHVAGNFISPISFENTYRDGNLDESWRNGQIISNVATHTHVLYGHTFYCTHSQFIQSYRKSLLLFWFIPILDVRF